MGALNARQRAFVNAYTSGETLGNATQSARAAGYSGSDATLAVTGSQLLRNPKVAKEIVARGAKAERIATLDLAGRRELMTQFASNAGKPDNVRLKALEMLCKSSGDFVERREVSGPSGAPIPIVHLSIESAEALAEKGLKHG